MKLHELLAVEGNLENQAAKAVTDLKNTFEKKRHLFEEKLIAFTPNTEGASQAIEAQSSIQSTIPKELAWISNFISKSLDASYRVSEANTQARADIILENGTVIAEKVPATALLELEKRIAEIHNLVLAIPTLDPAKGFSPDEARGAGFFQARAVNKSRTKKDKKVIVLYAATTEHPAQTQLIDVDVVTGTVSEQEWSSLITPAKKSEYISKVEDLGRAIRQARARANGQEVDTTKSIGANLLKHIFG